VGASPRRPAEGRGGTGSRLAGEGRKAGAGWPPEEEAGRRGRATRMGREGRLAKRARQREETEVDRGGGGWIRK
jgi:hypothetical protein